MEVKRKRKMVRNSKKDFVQLLPVEILEEIMSYLSAKDLGRCCQVSKSWMVIANSDMLWKKFLNKDNLENELLAPLSSSGPASANLSDLSQHKKYYVRTARTLHNWKQRNHQELKIDNVKSVKVFGNKAMLAVLTVTGQLYFYDLNSETKEGQPFPTPPNFTEQFETVCVCESVCVADTRTQGCRTYYCYKLLEGRPVLMQTIPTTEEPLVPGYPQKLISDKTLLSEREGILLMSIDIYHLFLQSNDETKSYSFITFPITSEYFFTSKLVVTFNKTMIVSFNLYGETVNVIVCGSSYFYTTFTLFTELFVNDRNVLVNQDVVHTTYENSVALKVARKFICTLSVLPDIDVNLEPKMIFGGLDSTFNVYVLTDFETGTVQKEWTLSQSAKFTIVKVFFIETDLMVVSLCFKAMERKTFLVHMGKFNHEYKTRGRLLHANQKLLIFQGESDVSNRIHVYLYQN